MFLNNSISTKVDGTDYTIRYSITENEAEKEIGLPTEYGIRCTLFCKGSEVSREEVMHISPNSKRVYQMLLKLVRNQVFPVHLRDVLEDLLVLEYEYRKCKEIVTTI